MIATITIRTGVVFLYRVIHKNRLYARQYNNTFQTNTSSQLSPLVYCANPHSEAAPATATISGRAI